MTVRTEEITGIVYTVTNGEGNCYFASSHVDAGQTVDMTNRWFENHDNNPECYLSLSRPPGKTGTWTVNCSGETAPHGHGTQSIPECI
jgi:hypothetical protein